MKTQERLKLLTEKLKKGSLSGDDMARELNELLHERKLTAQSNGPTFISAHKNQTATADVK